MFEASKRFLEDIEQVLLVVEIFAINRANQFLLIKSQFPNTLILMLVISANTRLRNTQDSLLPQPLSLAYTVCIEANVTLSVVQTTSTAWLNSLILHPAPTPSLCFSLMLLYVLECHYYLIYIL